jgi:hypothetical protein
MRKSVAALFLTLLCFSTMPSQTIQLQNSSAENAREQRKLRGLVKTLRAKWCLLSKHPNQTGKYRELAHSPIETVTFDISGREISRRPIPYSCATGALSEILQKHERNYDDQGRILEETTYSSTGNLIDKTTYEYTWQGKVSTLVRYGADAVAQYTWKNEFDPAGNQMKARFYGAGQTLSKATEYRYNEQGQVIEMAEFDGDGTLRRKTSTEYEYDSQGNWIKSIESEFVTEGEKSFFKPYRVEYRFISYYSENAGQKTEGTRKQSEKH